MARSSSASNGGSPPAPIASMTSAGTPCSSAILACAHHSNSAFQRGAGGVNAKRAGRPLDRGPDPRPPAEPAQMPADAWSANKRVERANQAARLVDKLAATRADDAVPHLLAAGVQIVVAQVGEPAHRTTLAPAPLEPHLI